MKRNTPPVVLQSLLAALLAGHRREDVTGDMEEMYAERAGACGRGAATAWYARQVASFVPAAVESAFRRTPVLVLICCFTALCGGWLGTMDIVLHHHDLLRHEAIAGLIVGQGLLTLVTLPLAGMAVLRWAALAGGIAVTWLGGSALYATLHSNDMEGYILVIAALLIVQAVLTWRALLRRGPAVA